jgi:hypothetical protein
MALEAETMKNRLWALKTLCEGEPESDYKKKVR